MNGGSVFILDGSHSMIWASLCIVAAAMCGVSQVVVEPAMIVCLFALEIINNLGVGTGFTHIGWIISLSRTR